jgi:hypothetical protein
LASAKAAKEDKAGWSAFLKHLKGRGLHGVRLLISDACMGLSGFPKVPLSSDERFHHRLIQCRAPLGPKLIKCAKNS